MATRVCPNDLYANAVFTPANASTFLSGTTFTTPPVYNPELNSSKVPITVRGASYDVNLFSITKMIESRIRNRYTPPATEFWRVSSSSTLSTSGQNVNIYNDFLTTDIPGKTGAAARKIILPTTAADTLPSLQGNLTGEVSAAKESISYDLLYSLQYEYCFYSKIFSTLMKDYVKVQQNTNNVYGTNRDSLIMSIVNNLNATRLRINDLTEMAAYVGTAQSDQLSTLKDRVNQFVTDIDKNVKTLNTNANILFGRHNETGFRYRQLELSDEKNSYANQLLAMYGFANLIALGLLFYIYKS